MAKMVGFYEGIDVYGYCKRMYQMTGHSDQAYYYKHPSLACGKYVVCYLGYGKVMDCAKGWQLDENTGRCSLLCDTKGLVYFVTGGLALVALLFTILGVWMVRIRNRLKQTESEASSLVSRSVSLY